MRMAFKGGAEGGVLLGEGEGDPPPPSLSGETPAPTLKTLDLMPFKAMGLGFTHGTA